MAEDNYLQKLEPRLDSHLLGELLLALQLQRREKVQGRRQRRC